MTSPSPQWLILDARAAMPSEIMFHLKATRLMENRLHAHRVARRYGRLAGRKYGLPADELAEVVFPGLIEPINDELAKIGVHPGNFTIH